MFVVLYKNCSDETKTIFEKFSSQLEFLNLPAGQDYSISHLSWSFERRTTHGKDDSVLWFDFLSSTATSRVLFPTAVCNDLCFILLPPSLGVILVCMCTSSNANPIHCKVLSRLRRSHHRRRQGTNGYYAMTHGSPVERHAMPPFSRAQRAFLSVIKDDVSILLI